MEVNWSDLTYQKKKDFHFCSRQGNTSWWWVSSRPSPQSRSSVQWRWPTFLSWPSFTDGCGSWRWKTCSRCWPEAGLTTKPKTPPEIAFQICGNFLLNVNKNSSHTSFNSLKKKLYLVVPITLVTLLDKWKVLSDLYWLIKTKRTSTELSI